MFMRDEFLHRKEQILTKSDKSFIGSLDKRVQTLYNNINSSNDMYTTSSCSGRVIIKQFNNKKQHNVFLYTSHDIVSFNEIIQSIQSTDKIQFPLEILQESLILHVAVRDEKSALRFIEIAKKSGCNQCGIISIQQWGVIAEIICDISLQQLVLSKDFFNSNPKYFEEIIYLMNTNLENNWKCIFLFENLIEEFISKVDLND